MENMDFREDAPSLAADADEPSSSSSSSSSPSRCSLSSALRDCFSERTCLDRSTCDVRMIAAGGRFARAHRAVLAAVSPLLADIFAGVDPYQNGELDVIIPDMKYQDLQCFLEFVYLGGLGVGHLKRRGVVQKWMKALGMETNMVREVSVGDDGDESIEEDQQDKAQDCRESMAVVAHCEDCNQDFRSQNSYRLHRATVHPTEKSRHACIFCGRRFRHKATLDRHERLEHSSAKYKCESCDKEYKHERELADHRNVHTMEKSYPCDLCPARLQTRKQFYNHRESHREAVAPCHVCGKRLKNVACYKAHMKNHAVEASHACNSCGKAFKRLYDLTVLATFKGHDDRLTVYRSH